MTNEELFSHVETAIRRVMRLKDEPILPSTTLIAGLGVESIDFLDLSCELEKITDEELDFREIIAELRAKTGQEVVDVSVENIVDFLQRRAERKVESQTAV